MPKRSWNLETTILTLVVALIADRFGYKWISLILSCLSVFFLIRELDWPREFLGLDIRRWQFWFGLQCVCYFFTFSIFGIISEGSIAEISESPGRMILPPWIIVYMFLWFLSPFYVRFRHDYLVPKSLRNYLGERSPSEYDALRQKASKLEGGILALCAIIGFGFSDYLDFMLLGVAFFLAGRRLLTAEKARSHSHLVGLVEKNFDQSERRFWKRFASASHRLNGTFFIFSFVFFINLPSLSLNSSDELATLFLLSVAMMIVGAGIQFNWSIRKIKVLVTATIVLLTAFIVIKGDPAAFPLLRQSVEPNFEAQSFLLLPQMIMVFLGLFNLSVESQRRFKDEKAIAIRLKNLARETWYLVVIIAYAITLLWSYAAIPLNQIKLLTVVGLALLVSVPCFKDMRI